MNLWKEQRVWVTGASRGLGAAIAADLAQQGAFVLGTATQEAGAQQCAAAINQVGGHGAGGVLHLGEHDGLAAQVAALMEAHGAPTILINNAGITEDQLLLRMKPETWHKVLNVNLTGTMLLTQACLKPMLRARFGRIVSISSVVAASGNPGQTNYCAAKAGLEGFSKALALEVAERGITVNTVAPGFVQSDMTQQLNEAQRQALLARIPMKCMGTPENIAQAVRFLAAPDNVYTTGVVLHVNGGLYLA